MTDSNLISATAQRAIGNGKPVPPLRLVNARRGSLTAPGNKSEEDTNAAVSNSPDLAVVSRVEAWAVQNGLNLAEPLGKSTLRAIALHAQVEEPAALAAIEHLRAERGVSASLTANEMPGGQALGTEVDAFEEPAEEPWCGYSDNAGPVEQPTRAEERLLKAMERRGLTLTEPLPKGTRGELAAELKVKPATITSGLVHLRRKWGIVCAVPEPPAPPANDRQISSTLADTPAPAPSLEIPMDPHALAMLLVHDLRAVDGASRPAALIEAAKLLRSTLR